MGQKVSPKGLRVGINRNWDSNWYAEPKDVPALIKEDHEIRQYLYKNHKNAEISLIEIERLKSKTKDRIKITVFASNIGLIAGQSEQTKNKIVKTLEYKTKKEIILNLVRVAKPNLDAQLVAESIAKMLENRASFRRVQKNAIDKAMYAGALGVKTLVSGRLGGAEIARSEGYSEGRVSLHTLRADIDYGTAEAQTTYGILGVKVWIYKGEIQGKELKSRKEVQVSSRPHRPIKGGKRNVSTKKN